MKVLINAGLVKEQMAGIGRWSYEITRRVIECDQYQWVVSCPNPGIFKSVVKNDRIKYVISPCDKRDRILYENIQLRTILINERVDVYLNLNYGIPLFMPRNIRCITTIYDLCPFVVPNTFGFISGLYKRIAISRSSKRSDLLICVSKNTAQDAVKYLKARENKISVIYGAVNELFTRPTSLSRIRDRKYILAVGTLEPRKNLNRLVQAFDQYVYKRFPNLDLLIVGDSGWLMKGFKANVERLKSSTNIKFLGRINDELLVQLYKNAEMFVYPSLYEGFGLPPLEAMSVGCPVIVSGVSSLPEVVGDYGIYVNPYSVVDIADKICQQLSQPDKTITFKKTTFSWQNSSDELLRQLSSFKE